MLSAWIKAFIQAYPGVIQHIQKGLFHRLDSWIKLFIQSQKTYTERQTLARKLLSPCFLTVSCYCSHDDKHIYTRDFTHVNVIALVYFYINRCVFARGVCSRVSVKTPSKTQKNTTPTPSLTVNLLILSSHTMCQNHVSKHKRHRVFM